LRTVNRATRRTIFSILRAFSSPSCFHILTCQCRYGLTETSRLGCQVKLTPSMHGVQVAAQLSNAQLALSRMRFCVPFVLPNPYDRILVWNVTQPVQRRSRLTVSQCKLPEATRNFYVDGHKPKPH
jgi:hypothetical protein